MAFRMPPTRIISRAHTAKFLNRKSLMFMMGSLARNSDQIRPIMPMTKSVAKKRMKSEANQASSSPLSSIICIPAIAMVRNPKPR